MCAIIGMASNKPRNNQNWIIDGRDNMMHRGPDDKGDWHSSDYRVRFAHRRLSIIDQSNSGHQPMENLSARVTIVFNGEIYNYRELKKLFILDGYKFNSSSDTEVLIAAWIKWGTECVNHIKGMFAFAIHDYKAETIFLARDIAGEKPLYYSYHNRELRFSSELKGLLSDKKFSRSINFKSLNLYLQRGYVPGELCILENINKLPPANALLFKYRTNKIKTWPYWKPSRIDLSENSQSELLEEEFETLLERSVKQQLHADVPVGVLLSGGLDSSLITAMASRTGDQVNTFTVNFSGHLKYNESEHAKLVANHFNTNHTEIDCGQVSPEIMNKIARQFDEPICDSSMLPTYLLCNKVQEYCKVVLGGDGGDELFGGYAYYKRLLYLESINRWSPKIFRKFLLKSSNSLLPLGFNGKYLLESIGMDLDKNLPLIGSFFEKNDRLLLLKDKTMFENTFFENNITESQDIIERATIDDFKNFLSEDVLVKIDRSSMLNSLEVRSPFLDKKIIDFAFGKVHSSLKVSKNRNKIFLKKFASNILPKNFDFERKQGFSVPLSSWMKKGPWRDLIHDTLLKEKCLFDKNVVYSLIKGLDSGMNNSERLFSLLLIELWKDEYSVN